MGEPLSDQLDLIPTRLEHAKQAVERARMMIPEDRYPEARACLEDAEAILHGILRRFPPRMKRHDP